MKNPAAGLLRAASICGVLAPIVAFCAIAGAVSISPWFNWEKNALSDLGVRQGSDVIFNSGLVAAGGLAAIFSLGLFLTMKNGIGKVTAVLFLVDSIALVGIGVFPETAGEIHLWFSVVFFATFSIFAISFFIYSITQKWLKMAVGALVAGAGATLPWTFRWEGVAIPETISALFASSLTLALGLILLKKGEMGR
ncbi:MAG: DUF998 domain-containing protein [Candidatus Hadarchaeales archaeon]